jgi:NADH-quinone oxidoreductase subunit L
MPVTFWTFLIGTLALCGMPPFSGFYSKDAILAQAYEHSMGLFILAVVVAVLTTFYMFRLVFVAFLGGPKTGNAGHAHESPKLMTVPLLVLAVPSIFAGFFGINQLLEAQLGDKKVVQHAVEHLNVLDQIFAPFNHAPMAAGAGMLAVLFGFFAAFGLYSGAASDPLPSKLGALSRAMQNRFYFDGLYDSIIALTQDAFATVADWFDRWIISGLFVKGLTGVTELFGRALRLVQTGNLQTYSFLFVAGLALLLLYVLRH